MSTTQEITKDYPFIGWWGNRLGSLPSYVKDEKARAKADGAPNTAIYPQASGLVDGPRTWRTIHDITNPVTLADLKARFGGDVLEVTK